MEWWIIMERVNHHESLLFPVMWLKTIINNPQNHHKWVIYTFKNGVVYYCFTHIIARTIFKYRACWTPHFSTIVQATFDYQSVSPRLGTNESPSPRRPKRLSSFPSILAARAQRSGAWRVSDVLVHLDWFKREKNYWHSGSLQWACL